MLGLEQAKHTRFAGCPQSDLETRTEVHLLQQVTWLIHL